MKRITDKAFRYTPAAETDIRKTFARIRREQAQNTAEIKAKVTCLPKARSKNGL